MYVITCLWLARSDINSGLYQLWLGQHSSKLWCLGDICSSHSQDIINLSFHLKYNYIFIPLSLTSKAESNVQGIHISDPERAIPSYGLTEAGKQQAEKVRSHSPTRHTLLCAFGYSAMNL